MAQVCGQPIAVFLVAGTALLKVVCSWQTRGFLSFWICDMCGSRQVVWLLGQVGGHARPFFYGMWPGQLNFLMLAGMWPGQLHF